MDKKTVIIFVVLLIIILIGGYFAILHVSNKREEEIPMEEYTPQEEISEEQMRQTIVSLYFISKETKQIIPEARLVDIKEMMSTPYDKLIELLIEGPKNEKNERILPEDTKILKTFLENDCVTIDFSKEFLNFEKGDETIKNNLINTLVNTLTELTEVNNIKIIIEGNENEEFKEIYTRK